MMKLYKSMFALIFAFSCAVLHALPLPKPQEKFLNYCNRLKDVDQGEMSEFISQCTYQFADYASHNPGVSLATFTKKVSIRDVFKVAQILFSIPATLQLPKDTATQQPLNHKRQLLDALPAEFDRQTYLAVAKNLNIPDKTAEKQISRFVDAGLLNRPSHGKYCKS